MKKTQQHAAKKALIVASKDRPCTMCGKFPPVCMYCANCHRILEQAIRDAR